MNATPKVLPTNSFKQGIMTGRPQIGFWLTLGSPTATEIAAGAGFDWLLIDMEHTANELPEVVHHLRAAVGGTAEPIVRIPWNEPIVVKRLLDLGVRSLMFPQVQSAEEAKAAVASTRYPPLGIRGVNSTSRATYYGRVPDYGGSYMQELCVIVQVESVSAMESIEEIAAVDGVDGIFIGPADLAASMGYFGQAGHTDVRGKVNEGLGRILKSGKGAGTINYQKDVAQKLIEDGFVFVAVGSDMSILSRQTDAMAAQYKNQK